MTERDVFEVRFQAAVRGYVGRLSSDLDPAELAHRIAVAQPRRHGFAAALTGHPVAAPRLAWVLLLLAALLAALVGGTLLVGSQLQPKVPAVVPPIVPAYVCPPGSTPDEPGPADQARPSPGYWWSPMAFDRRAGKLVVLEGATGVPGTVVETWTFDVCTNTWARMHPNREPPLQVQSLVYDVDSDLTIGVHSQDWVDPEVIGSVWAYDLEANTWTEHGAARTNGLGFYDPVSGLVIADGWTYDGGADTWTPIAWEGAGCGACVLDTSVDRIIEYAGDGDLAETRLLDPRTGASTRSGAATPVFRMGMWALPAIVYDEAAKRTVVAGDFQWGAYDATEDRWEILYERDPSGGLPKPREYDPVNKRLLVLDSGIGDIVAFDLVTREWTVLLLPAEE